jgi:hypothetical protein
MGFGLVGAAGRPLPGARSRRGVLAHHQGCHHAAARGLGAHQAGAPRRAGPACPIAQRPSTRRKPFANAAADRLQQPIAVIVCSPDREPYAHPNRLGEREPLAVRFAQPQLLGVRDAHADPNAHGNRDADTDSDAHPNSHANPDPHTDTDTDTDAYA